ncbi:hypothetical protein LZ30DRAFT_715299 [Colletotrichum cereale]|nr:hypothetical protein LZ30DRAFT_715299 [Colletotrichum cereale]
MFLLFSTYFTFLPLHNLRALVSSRRYGLRLFSKLPCCLSPPSVNSILRATLLPWRNIDHGLGCCMAGNDLNSASTGLPKQDE